MNNIVPYLTDIEFVASISFMLSILFVFMTYKIHKQNNQYFDVVSGFALVLFLAISGFLNGYAWLSMGQGASGAVIWLLIGLGLEIAKPILIRGGLHTIVIRVVIILLQAVSIASATTVIHSTLEQDTNKYTKYRFQMNKAGQNNLVEIYKQQLLDIKPSSLSNVGVPDLNRKLSYYKTLQALATPKDRKRGYRKKLLLATIYNSTTRCTNSSSPYYTQRQVCPNIIALNDELAQRIKVDELKALLRSAMQSNEKTQDDLIENTVSQNPWMTVASQVVSLVNPNYITVPKNNEEIEIMKKQSKVTSLWIAGIMGFLIELILHHIAFKTYNRYEAIPQLTLWTMIKLKIKERYLPDNTEHDYGAIVNPANLETSVKTNHNSRADHSADNIIDNNESIEVERESKTEQNSTEVNPVVNFDNVMNNLQGEVLLEIYNRTMDNPFDGGTGRYLDIAATILQNGYSELNKVQSQQEMLKLYKSVKGKGVQFAEISSAMKLIKPVFAFKSGRSFLWISKKDLNVKLRSIGINVII